MSNSYTGREIEILERGGTVHDWQRSVSGAKINVQLIRNESCLEAAGKSPRGLYTHQDSPTRLQSVLGTLQCRNVRMQHEAQERGSAYLTESMNQSSVGQLSSSLTTAVSSKGTRKRKVPHFTPSKTWSILSPRSDGA